MDLRWQLLTGVANIPVSDSLYRVTLFAAFIGLAAFMLRTLHNRTSDSAQRTSDVRFCIGLPCFILLSRWPGLLAPLLNTDEAYFASAALKLLHDPVYWRSADVSTSGPINVYPLMLPACFGFNVDLASGRLIGLGAVIVSCICLYLTVRRVYGVHAGQLSALMVGTTLAVATFPDYVHYSSEHIPIALLSISLLVVASTYARGGAPGNATAFGLGVLIGAVPYAKLQAGPIALAIGCVFLHIALVRRISSRSFIYTACCFALGCGMCSAVVLALSAVFGVQDTFINSYVLQNIYFSNFQGRLRAKARVTSELLKRANQLWTLLGFATFAAVGAVAMSLLSRFRMSRAGCDSARMSSLDSTWLVYSLGILGAAAFAVAQPQRDFDHYLLFLVIPSGLLIGVVIGEADRCFERRADSSSRWRHGAAGLHFVVIGACALQVIGHIRHENPYLAKAAEYRESYVSPISKVILEHASPGQAMAIWGWAPELHVETGVVQATSESVPVWQFRPNPNQPYFVTRYANELRAANAALFVDTQVPGDRAYEWLGVRGQRYTEHPEIARIVNEQYRLVAEVSGAKIYSLLR